MLPTLENAKPKPNNKNHSNNPIECFAKRNTSFYVRIVTATALITAAILTITSAANAQLKRNHPRRHYHDIIQKIVKDPAPSPYLYQALRQRYTKIQDFTPDAQTINQRLSNLAKTIDPDPDLGAPDPQNTKDQDDFKRLLLTHAANIGVIKHALNLSTTYPKLLNAQRLEQTYNGLKASLTLGGNGQSFATSFDTYTFDEEYELIKALNLTPISRQIARHKSIDFAIHTVREPATGTKKQIYINISVITKHTPKLIEKPKTLIR